MKKYILTSCFWGCLGFLLAQNPLLDIINKNKTAFGDIFDRPDHYEVQIIYTEIDRDKNNKPHFKSHYYHLDTTKSIKN